MAGLCEVPHQNTIRVLEPGAGSGVLACALCEAFVTDNANPLLIELEAYETDHNLCQCLDVSLSYTKKWLESRNIVLDYRICTQDFIVSQAGTLSSSQLLLASSESQSDRFDIAISNPPYFKIPKSDPRARAAASIVHGQPNIYALFMAISASLLKQGGQFCFITPRSYTAGAYFRLFRERFFEKMRPEAIHLFHSRRDTFKGDNVLQENIILFARRDDGWTRRSSDGVKRLVSISSSQGTRDLSQRSINLVPISEILDFSSHEKVLRTPYRRNDQQVTRIVDSWSGNLRRYGLEISTGPVVPFRHEHLILSRRVESCQYAPLIWMQSVKVMFIEWPGKVNGKGQFIIVNDDSAPLLVRDRNYVILRRFSAKEQERRLTAAPLLRGQLSSDFIGLENHLNYIHRPGSELTKEEAYGLATLLNSRLLDTYFRTYNGNTQVSATEIRSLPLPPIELIIEIGRVAMQHGILMNLDALVEDVLGLGHIYEVAVQEAIHG